jgi:capsular exopolysaccharide synthesis family protein
MSKVFEALQQLELENDGLSASFSPEAQAILRQPISVAESAGLEVDQPVEEAPADLPETLTVERVLAVRVANDSPLMPFEASFANVGEQYRIIRTKIVQHPMTPHVIAISSVDPGDGKTTTAVNMAAALALKSDTKVLLVDCDLRRGQIGPLLGFANEPGLTNILGGTNSLNEAIVQVKQLPNLFVLAAGTALANPVEVLDSANWRRLIDQLRKHFDYVVLDTPPLGLVADSDLILQVTDGVVLVVRPDFTTRSRCLSTLASISATALIGVILNGVSKPYMGKGGAYYSYAPAVST